MLADVFSSEIQIDWVMRWSKIRSFQKDLKTVINSVIHRTVVCCNPAFVSNDQNRIPPCLHPADHFGINNRIIGGDVDTPDAVSFQGELGRVMELVVFCSGGQGGENLPRVFLSDFFSPNNPDSHFNGFLHEIEGLYRILWAFAKVYDAVFVSHGGSHPLSRPNSEGFIRRLIQ